MGGSCVKEDPREQSTITIKPLSALKGIQGEKALCVAAKWGNYQGMEELLQAGIHVDAKHFNLQAHYYMTPLQFAIERDHLQCVKLLIDYGANLNAVNDSGYTALHMAAEKNDYECMKVLLEAGADPSIPIGKTTSKLNGVCSFTRDMIAMHLVGMTALHMATIYRDVKTIEDLMRHGADCDAVDKKGRTSLYIAAEAGCEECVSAILRNIQGVACVSLPCSTTLDSPLHHAVRYRMVECVKQMVRLGSDVNHINCKGLSPLHLLLLTTTGGGGKCTMEILKSLVLDSHNIDINKTTKKGRTALDIAFNDGDPEILKFLITHCAQLSCNVSTSLRFIISSSSGFEVLKCFVSYMPRLPSARLFYGHSPSDILQQLCKILNEEELKYLGIVTSIVTDNGAVQNVEILPECNCVHLFSYSEATVMPSNPLQQPLLGKIYEVVTQKLEHMKDDRTHVNFPDHYKSLSNIKGLLWYQRLASNPRTLKHCCRCSIRKSIGASNLKHISKLPLPESMKAYLFYYKYAEQVDQRPFRVPSCHIIYL